MPPPPTPPGKTTFKKLSPIRIKEKKLQLHGFDIKNLYIDKGNAIVYECNNTYHENIKMKHVDVKWNTYIDFNAGNNDKDPLVII